jgi:hypothetical protein
MEEEIDKFWLSKYSIEERDKYYETKRKKEILIEMKEKEEEVIDDFWSTDKNKLI